MKQENPKLRTFLDAGVPDSVGRIFSDAGHSVIYHREALDDGVADEVVCATALANDAILVAIDGDMKRIAKRYGMTPQNERFQRLNVIRLCCNEPLAAKRVVQALSLIQHEWNYSQEKTARRLWIDIGPHFIRTHR